MATATTDPARLPPALRLPKVVQAVLFATALQYRIAPSLSRHFGGPFTVNFPLFGQAVVISDPILVKDVFSTSTDLIERPTGRGILGRHSVPGRRSALPATNSSRAASWWSRRFTGSG